MREDYDALYNEVNDFILVERALKQEGFDCFITCPLQLFNITRRTVMSQLMQEPFPHKPDTFMYELKQFMFDYRRMDFEPQSYAGLRGILAVRKPSLYEHSDQMGDSLEGLQDLFSLIIDDECALIHKQHKDKMKKAKFMNKEKFGLTYEECLQQTQIFKTFGFRTLTQTGCMKCKHVSRKINF